MEVVRDYNGQARWSLRAVRSRYAQHAAELGIVGRELKALESADLRRGMRWVYPVMMDVIKGIRAGDAACIELGVELVEEDATMPFGKILKSNAARALRGAVLTDKQQERIRQRVFGMLRTLKVPREFEDYARLVKRIGYGDTWLEDLPQGNQHVQRWNRYLREAYDGRGAGEEKRKGRQGKL